MVIPSQIVEFDRAAQVVEFPSLRFDLVTGNCGRQAARRPIRTDESIPGRAALLGDFDGPRGVKEPHERRARRQIDRAASARPRRDTGCSLRRPHCGLHQRFALWLPSSCSVLMFSSLAICAGVSTEMLAKLEKILRNI